MIGQNIEFAFPILLIALSLCLPPSYLSAAIAKGLSLENAQKAVTMEAYKGLKWPDLLVPDVIAVYNELTAGTNR